MNSWMAERDRLLAQANSLVKNAAPAAPAARAPLPSHNIDKPHDRPLTPQPRPVSAAAPASLPASPSRTRSANEGEADHQPLTFRRTLRSDVQPTATIPIPMLAGNERDDLEIRVSRFRAQQTRLSQERQAFYEQQAREMRSRFRRDDDV